MNIIGINLGKTMAGQELRDGGACLITDGDIVVAIAEERISRKKTDGGFKLSLDYCLEYAGLNYSDINMVVASSCIELPRKDIGSWGLPGEIDPSKCHYIHSHHLSHAYSTFGISPFEEALIIVMDAGGNLLHNNNPKSWWACSREQNSYYLGRNTSINLLERDFDTPYATGFGEIYRAATYFLGWHSYIESGKTMALSASGEIGKLINLPLFDFLNGKIVSLVRNSPTNPLLMLTQYAAENGYDIGKPRLPHEPITEQHKSVAAWVQYNLELALIQKVNYLIKNTKVKNVCLAGGVALNCVVNSKILSETLAERVFIVPAAGDTGQCLGNALYGYYYLSGSQERIKNFSTYLGKSYKTSTKEISTWISKANIECKIIDTDDYIKETANMLSKGYLVAWVNGRSEFGPRALGARSLLGDSRIKQVYDRLLAIKQREPFRPFAPCILADKAHEYFNLQQDDPYMLLTACVKPYKSALLSSVVHVDSSSRIQTVTATNNENFDRLLREYYDITGTPLLINTSLNRRGEPLVETHQDAFDFFRYTDVDVLVLDGVILKKKKSDTIVLQGQVELQNLVIKPDHLFQKVYYPSKYTVKSLYDIISKDFPQYDLIERDYLSLLDDYVKWLQAGNKSTTIRYRRNAISFPSQNIIPLFNSGTIDKHEHTYVDNIIIKKLLIKPFGWLNDKDGVADGFSGEKELKEALIRIYGPIRDYEFVSIFYVEPKTTP